ncbi:related to pectate lyase precursor [Armillaria ostoyae]|uniref:Pectate lyase n=1 Tax=Armillaria ostoyae TaxID=47428 RepID=A0A284S6K8_ARMOS|nr:related to pectate lyase precursor [Armillaria ostoyae]
MFSLAVFSLSSLATLAAACDAWTGGLPTPTGTVSSSAVIEVAAGKTFDGGWKKYDRGSGACKYVSIHLHSSGYRTYWVFAGDNQKETGKMPNAIFFYLHEGATLQNVTIGANQAEGVHCTGYCTLNFVWFEDVCGTKPSFYVEVNWALILTTRIEDAITIKNDEYGDYTNIIGGGAYHAEDKVVQHNGCGTVNIINFYVEDYGKLYRSCGNSQCYRNVYIKGVVAVDGGTLAGINYNYGDTATILDSCYDTSHPCTLYDGCNDGCEPEVVGYCSG